MEPTPASERIAQSLQMPSTPGQTELELAFGMLRDKRAVIDKLFSYYDGNQPLQYSTERLQEAFGDMFAYFTQNWCGLVVDSTCDKLSLKGFGNKDKGIADELTNIWQSLNLSLEAQEVHEVALITGFSYIIIWKQENEIEEFYNDPRMCHIFYQSDNPKKKWFACKSWKDDNAGKAFLNLYFADRIDFYVSPKIQPEKAGDFVLDKSEPNLYGEIPVFCFQAKARGNIGELTPSIIQQQDAINKTMSDMMIAAEFEAFKQRIYITTQDLSDLKNEPGRIHQLAPSEPGMQPASAQELGGSDLSNFLSMISNFVNTIAIISRTPKHYLFDTGAQVSGDALVAMEAPLNKKAIKYQNRFSQTWKEVAAFLLKLDGKTVDPATIIPIWEAPETIQPVARAQLLSTLKTAGVPTKLAARKAGWSEDEIVELDKEMQADKLNSTTEEQAMLSKLRAVSQSAPAANPQPVNQPQNAIQRLFNPPAK
jgi:hypothetical protein